MTDNNQSQHEYLTDDQGLPLLHAGDECGSVGRGDCLWIIKLVSGSSVTTGERTLQDGPAPNYLEV